MILPKAILATRASPRQAWQSGPDRDPAHPAWKLRTGDPEVRRRDHSATTAFDAPIAVGITLGHPSLSLMACARRALCVGAVSEGFGNGPLAARGVSTLLLRMDWLIRWCADRGVRQFSALRPTDLRDYGSALRTGSVLDLVDLEARLASLSDAEVDSVLSGGADPLADVDNTALAEMLGITAASLRGAPTSFKRALASRCGRHVPPGPDPERRRTRPSLNAMAAHVEIWSRLRFATEQGWLTDGLDFRPFDASLRSRARMMASRLNGTASRTPTRRPEDLMGLLSAATRVVALRGSDIVASVGRAKDGCDADRRAVEHDVRHLLAAVALLVGGMSGRRGGEVVSIRRRTLGMTANGATLTTLIEKSSRSIQTLPVPALVAFALSMLMTLASTADQATCWVFRIALPWGRVIELDPAADLAAFATAEGLDSDVDLASHQLRRAMALLWEYGYRAGTPAGLAWALRHTDLAAGETYVTEAVRGRVSALRDATEATTRAAIAEMTPELRSRLLSLRDRLRHSDHPLGRPPCAGRYGKLPLALLESWSKGLGEHRAPVRSFPWVTIGSQAVRQGMPPLLATARAHAAALARLGVLP